MIIWQPDTHRIAFFLDADLSPIGFETTVPAYQGRIPAELYAEILRENMFLNRAYADGSELEEAKHSVFDGEITVEELKESLPNSEEIDSEIEDILSTPQ
jgi:hypothetical protein